MRRAPIECGDRRERRETCERRKADHLCVSHRSMMQPLSALHQKIQFVGEHIGASQRHYSLLSLWYKLYCRFGISCRFGRRECAPAYRPCREFGAV